MYIRNTTLNRNCNVSFSANNNKGRLVNALACVALTAPALGCSSALINSNLVQQPENYDALPVSTQRIPVQVENPDSIKKPIPAGLQQTIETIRATRPDLARLAERSYFQEKSPEIQKGAYAEQGSTVENGELVGIFRYRDNFAEIEPSQLTNKTAHELQHFENQYRFYEKIGIAGASRNSIQNEASAFITGCSFLPEEQMQRDNFCNALLENGIEGLKHEIRAHDLYRDYTEYNDMNPQTDPAVSFARVAINPDGTTTFKSEISDGLIYNHNLAQNPNPPSETTYIPRFDLAPVYNETCPVAGPTPDCWEVKPPDGSTVNIFTDIQRPVRTILVQAPQIDTRVVQ